MSCVGASHVVRAGQLLSISPGLFLSSTGLWQCEESQREAHCKATVNLCLWQCLSGVFACECLLQAQSPPTSSEEQTLRAGGAGQLSLKDNPVQPINLHILRLLLVIHSLWFYWETFSVLKKSSWKNISIFYREGEAGGLHAILCKIPKTTKLTRWSSLFLSKSETRSQCSRISFFLIITKTSRTLHNTFTVPLKSDNFSDFIEKKKILL